MSKIGDQLGDELGKKSTIHKCRAPENAGDPSRNISEFIILSSKIIGSHRQNVGKYRKLIETSRKLETLGFS